MSRTINDIPANRRACYEWKDATHALPAAGVLVCVSIPHHADLRAIAEFKDGQWLRCADGEVLNGVTFWCGLPATPEDLDAEAKLLEKSTKTKSGPRPPAASELELKGLNA